MGLPQVKIYKCEKERGGDRNGEKRVREMEPVLCLEADQQTGK